MIRSPSPQLVPFKLHRFGQQRRTKPKETKVSCDRGPVEPLQPSLSPPSLPPLSILTPCTVIAIGLVITLVPVPLRKPRGTRLASINYQITGCHAHCVGRIARRIEYRLASGRVKAHQLRDSIVVVLANNGAARLVIQLYRKTLGCYISTGGSDGYVDVQFVIGQGCAVYCHDESAVSNLLGMKPAPDPFAHT